MRTEEIAKGLNAKSVGVDRWVSKCPIGHTDKGKSLYMKSSDGKTWLSCACGCSVGQILASMSLEWADLFEAAPTQEELTKFRAQIIHATAKRVKQMARCDKATNTMKEAQVALFDLRTKIPQDVLDEFDTALHLVGVARWTASLMRERV